MSSSKMQLANQSSLKGASSASPVMAPVVVAATVGEYKHPFSVAKRCYMTIITTLVCFFLMADTNLLAPNMSTAAEFFGFNEEEKVTKLGGYLSLAFFLTGAPAAVVAGYLADRVHRVWLSFVVLLCGSAPCLATYWVTQYWQFLLLRMLTGISVGGFYPVIFSLLGDIIPANKRSLAASLVQLTSAAGQTCGQLLSGFLGPRTDWRLPFLVVAAPAIVVAILMVLTVKEPPRGACEECLKHKLAAGESYNETITWEKVKETLRIPSNWLIITQGLFGCLPWGLIGTYLNDFLHTTGGLTIEASTVVVAAFGFGNMAGGALNGVIGQILYNRWKEAMPLYNGLAVLVGMLPIFYLINCNLASQSMALTVTVTAIGGALVVAGPNNRAIVLNTNRPEARGLANGLAVLTDQVGTGVGPAIVAAMVTGLSSPRAAFNVATSGWVPCGILLTSIVFTLRKDENRMQQRMEATIERRHSEMLSRAGSSWTAALAEIRVASAQESVASQQQQQQTHTREADAVQSVRDQI